ncbi:MAG: thiamine diphosphokinase [Lachnospiraceae bacterium]
MKKCYLICAGDFTNSTIPITNEDYVIAVDGGYSYCKMLGIKPNLIIGDFDSIEEHDRKEILDLKERQENLVIKLEPVKNDTDTLAALRVGLDKGFKEFRLYGATGGRFEHTFANIQCLLFLKEQGAVGYLVDGTGMMLVVKEEEVSFKESLEGYLSFLSLETVCTGVTIKNMKYEIEQETITNSFPIGISNEFIGKAGSIKVEKGAALVTISWES